MKKENTSQHINCSKIPFLTIIQITLSIWEQSRSGKEKEEWVWARISAIYKLTLEKPGSMLPVSTTTTGDSQPVIHLTAVHNINADAIVIPGKQQIQIILFSKTKYNKWQAISMHIVSERLRTKTDGLRQSLSDRNGLNGVEGLVEQSHSSHFYFLLSKLRAVCLLEDTASWCLFGTCFKRPLFYESTFDWNCGVLPFKCPIAWHFKWVLDKWIFVGPEKK